MCTPRPTAHLQRCARQVALAQATYFRTKLAPGSVSRSKGLLGILNNHVGPFMDKKYLVGGVTTQVHTKQDRLDIEFELRKALQKVAAAHGAQRKGWGSGTSFPGSFWRRGFGFQIP